MDATTLTPIEEKKKRKNKEAASDISNNNNLNPSIFLAFPPLPLTYKKFTRNWRNFCTNLFREISKFFISPLVFIHNWWFHYLHRLFIQNAKIPVFPAPLRRRWWIIG